MELLNPDSQEEQILLPELSLQPPLLEFFIQ